MLNERVEIVEGDQTSIDNNKKAQELLTSITFGESKYANWKVVLVDDNNTGMYGVLLETDVDNAIVAFRGKKRRFQESSIWLLKYKKDYSLRFV